MNKFFTFSFCLALFSLTAQTKYTIDAKNEYTFTEVKTFESIKDILSPEEINGFRFDPIRNKSVVELHFTIPNIKQYDFIFVERGDTAKGFTSCLLINLSQENISNETFVKIDKYPLPYVEQTNYRVRSVTKDGTIRYFPYIVELHEGDLQTREQQKLAFEKRLKDQKAKDELLLKDWEARKNQPIDESWKNLKPEIVSGGKMGQSEEQIVQDAAEKAKTDLEKKLDKIKQIEEELKSKIDELKLLMETTTDNPE